ncbi:MAG: hypothetical protein ABIJ74_02410 [archaeon]
MKPFLKSSNPDYFGMLYFGVAAIACIYYLFQDIEYLPGWIMAPLFYSLIIGLVSSFMLSIIDFYVTSGLKNKIDFIIQTFFGNLLFVGIILGVFLLGSSETQRELISSQAILIFGISLIHSVLSTYPFDKKEVTPTEKLKVWFFRFSRLGLVFGITAFVIIIFGYFGVVLFLLPWNNPDAILLNIIKYFCIFSGLTYFFKELAKKIKKKGIESTVNNAPAWSMKWNVALAAILIIILAILISLFDQNIGNLKRSILTFMFVYLAFFIISYYWGNFVEDANKDTYKPEPNVR